MTPADVEFDPFSDEYFNDPSDVYRRLRDEAPVYFSERYGFYALSRFDDVVTAHRDWQGFSSSRGVDLASLSTDPELLRHRRMIIMMDPPEHDVMRALVSRVFTPRAMAAGRADGSRGDLVVPHAARDTRRIRCGRRVLRAVPDGDHRPDARRAGGRSPAAPRVAGSQPASGPGLDVPGPWWHRSHDRVDRVLRGVGGRQASCIRATTCSLA